jgi:hypothetical protein
MWRIFEITLFVALSCYLLQGYDRNIKTFYRMVSIHFRYRWMSRRWRVLDRVLFNVLMIFLIGTYITTVIRL